MNEILIFGFGVMVGAWLVTVRNKTIEKVKKEKDLFTKIKARIPQKKLEVYRPSQDKLFKMSKKGESYYD